MNKAEFIKALAGKTNATIKDTNAFYDAFVETVATTLAKKEKIALVGFGTFEARKRAARVAINPRTKQKIKIAASVVPALKFGKSFKAKI